MVSTARSWIARRSTSAPPTSAAPICQGGPAEGRAPRLLSPDADLRGCDSAKWTSKAFPSRIAKISGTYFPNNVAAGGDRSERPPRHANPHAKGRSGEGMREIRDEG